MFIRVSVNQFRGARRMTFLLVLLLLVVIIWAVSEHGKRAGAERRSATLSTELSTTQQRNVALYQHSQAVEEQMRHVAYENSQLAKYRHIVDVEREVLALRNQGEAVVASANHQAAGVIAEAYTRAQAIAADALDAKRNAETYRLEARALRNVIEGYGDQYLIPTDSLLDDLAEAFGYAEAGINLKTARQRVKQMIKANNAATADTSSRIGVRPRFGS